MKLNSPSLPAIGIIICLTILGACKKTNNTGGNNPGGSDTTYIPVITPLGDTAGTPVSGSIGTDGGTLTSSDGRIQLVIPPGALSQTTNITIQPIVNLCPGGLGLAYDLLPTGTKFAIPASLVFHYTDDDVNGTEPLLLSSAFQDSAGAWQYNDTEKDVDTVNKKISFDINHFCANSVLAVIILQASPSELMENQTSTIKAQVWVNIDKGKKLITKTYNIPKSEVSNWRLNLGNGSSADGTLTPDGNSAVYHSPSSIDKDRTVDISCDINTPITVKLKGGQTKTIQKLNEYTPITLISGAYSFDVSIQCIMHHTSFFINDRYIDGATMQVDVKYNDVTISKVQNQAPSADPTTGKYGNSTVTFSPDPIGITDIDESKTTGKVDGFSNGKGNIIITVAQKSDAYYPLWNITDDHGGHKQQGGYLIGGQPTEISFAVSDKYQKLVSTLLLDPDSLVVTATPR